MNNLCGFMLPFPEMPLDEHQVLLYLFEGISFQTLQAEKKWTWEGSWDWIMPLTGSASVRAQELGWLPHLYPSEVPWAAGWDKLPRLKDWNTTSKHHVDQRWKQQAFPSGSSFRPFSLFSFHFESDNAAWPQPFMRLHSSGHRWHGACISLSGGSVGLGFPGFSSQASQMEKIYHFEQGRERLTESEQQSRALLPQVHSGVQIYSEAPKFICSTCPPRESTPSFRTLYEGTLKHPWALERTRSNTQGKTEQVASTDTQVPVALGDTMKTFVLNEVIVEVNGFRNSERSLSPHCTAVWFLSQEADEALLLSLSENLDANSSILSVYPAVFLVRGNESYHSMKERPHDLKKSWFWHFPSFRPFHSCHLTFIESLVAVSGWKPLFDGCSQLCIPAAVWCQNQ